MLHLAWTTEHPSYWKNPANERWLRRRRRSSRPSPGRAASASSSPAAAPSTTGAAPSRSSSGRPRGGRPRSTAARSSRLRSGSRPRASRRPQRSSSTRTARTRSHATWCRRSRRACSPGSPRRRRAASRCGTTSTSRTAAARWPAAGGRSRGPGQRRHRARHPVAEIARTVARLVGREDLLELGAIPATTPPAWPTDTAPERRGRLRGSPRAGGRSRGDGRAGGVSGCAGDSRRGEAVSSSLALTNGSGSKASVSPSQAAERRAGVVARPPGPRAVLLQRDVLDERVRHDQELPSRDERRVGPQLGQDVLVRVVGVEHDHDALDPAAAARACATTASSSDEPSTSGCAARADATRSSRGCAAGRRCRCRAPRPRRAARRIEAERISEPPRATPVSITSCGRVSQMISWSTTMSGGIWITGTPSQLHWYDQSWRSAATLRASASAASASSAAIRAAASRLPASNWRSPVVGLLSGRESGGLRRTRATSEITERRERPARRRGARVVPAHAGGGLARRRASRSGTRARSRPRG